MHRHAWLLYIGGMEIYLLRHGLAVERGTAGFAEDALRPLTPKGRRQLRKTAGAIGRLAGDFDLILSSPLARARQTAEILAGELGLKKRVKLSPALAPNGEAAGVLRQLKRERPGKVLLVGHEPDLSRLASWLVTGHTRLRMDLKKGGLCKLEATPLAAGGATLAGLLTPKNLKQMD